MATFWKSPSGAFSTVLDVRASANDTQLTVRSIVNLQAPGVLVIHRQDGVGNNTEDKMEFATFTGISGNVLTGVTRGVGGYTAKDHNAGTLVESFLSVTHWGDLISNLQSDFTADGSARVSSHVRLVNVTGVSGATMKGDGVFVFGGNATVSAVSGASGYSAIKLSIPLNLLPQLTVRTTAVGTSVAPVLFIQTPVTIKSISAVLKSPGSQASLVLDLNKNGTSIFTNQATRLSIPAIGTYASTASIGSPSFVRGDIITLDIDAIQ